MPGLDALPADQRTVLQLVLRQGRSYDAIARALRLDPAAVRRRAHAGLAGLVPPDGVAIRDRGRVADWLLGQREDGAADLVAQEGPARRWAAALRDELEPAATAGLPALPDAPADADPGPAATAAAAAAPGPTAPDAPTPAATSPDAPTPAATSPDSPAGGGRRPASRRGGALLLAGLALFTVIVAVVVGLISSGDDEGKPGTTSASTSTASSTSSSSSSGTADARVLAQVNLTAPKGAPAAKALGVVQVVEIQGKKAINAIVQGLPAPTKQAGFGIWLLGDGGRRWLGYFRNADQQGRLVAQGQLDQGLDITKYRRVLITRETAEPPKQPGTTYLSGAVDTGAARGSGGGQSSGSSGSSGTG
jgi:hypothetical protein